MLLQPDGNVLLCGPGSIAKFTPEGILDTLFGSGGLVVLNSYEMYSSAALQLDGKILCSNIYFNSNHIDNILLRRFFPDGKVDSLFGTNGMKVINIWPDDYARSLLPLPDGKIAIASVSDWKLALTRILQDGEPDQGFGSEGTAIIYFGGFNAIAEGAAIQTNGKLVVAGSAGRWNAVIARYLDDGSLDPSFGDGGKVVTDFKDFSLLPTSMVLLPDDKIVLAGGGGDYFSLLRYLPDGELDASFGENGLMKIEIGHYLAKCHALALQPDGKLVLGGIAFNDRFLARVNPDGGLDLTFGEGGLVINQDDEYFNPILDIKIQPDGKIVACGYNGGNGFNLFRYLPDGSPDYSFNFLGKAKTGLYEASSLLLLPDGKILVAGSTGTVKRNPKIVRFLPFGAIDLDFEFSDYFTSIQANFGYIEDIDLQDNGKIVYIGYVKINQSLFIGRALPSGSIDSSFFETGHIIYLNSGFPAIPRFVTVLQNGKIVVTGGSENWDNWAGIGIDSDFFILRIPQDPLVGLSDPAPGIDGITLSPNPLQSQAALSYELAYPETLSILLYDASGQLVSTFVSAEKRPAGLNRELLNIPKELPDGVYYLTVKARGEQRTISFVK
ncbi:MAG: T9SS type A sorting domain-containing protein [Saprospirales bacterium]|nr:T9SS type A sorting domain-containing protein [Saprospirales bacterium]